MEARLRYSLSFCCIVLIFLSSFAVASPMAEIEPYPGYWRLAGTSVKHHEPSEPESAIMGLSVSDGQATGQCFGGGSSAVYWTPMPQVAEHRQVHTFNFRSDFNGQLEPLDLSNLQGAENVEARRAITFPRAACERLLNIAQHYSLNIYASGATCPNFQGYGELSVPAIPFMISKADEMSTAEFTFPHVSKVFICSFSEMNYLSDDDWKQIRDATKKEDYLKFDLNFYARTAGGDATLTYHYVWKPGKAPIETPDKGCSKNDDCNEGQVCSVCNECISEKDALQNGDFTFSYKKIMPELSKKTMKNQITESSILRVTLIPEFKDNNGKVIDYCKIAMPIIDSPLTVEAEMMLEPSYAGFTLGRADDEREEKYVYTIDNIFQKEHKALFVISPNDRKKEVGAIGEIEELIELRVMLGNKELHSEELEITLLPVSFVVNFNMPHKQIQQGTVRAIKYKIEGKDSKVFFVKQMLAGPGVIFQVKDKKKGAAEEAIHQSSDWVYLTAKPKEQIEFGYQAPKMGNFDIGKAMDSLSMVDLQVEAGKQILQDALLAYAGEYVSGIEDNIGDLSKMENAQVRALGRWYKNNPGNFDALRAQRAAKELIDAKKHADNVELVTRSYKLGAGVHSLSGLGGSIEGAGDDLGKALDLDEDTVDGPTTIETAANVGIVAIDVLQLGVGVVTFIPNKIPGVSKLSAGVQTAFSAATNIWKANFKYISEAEKIDRAKELFYPVVIVQIIEDESGWFTSNSIVMQVAFHQV
jgi:hypothetical protein